MVKSRFKIPSSSKKVELDAEDSAVIDLIERSAELMGNCNPVWLKERRIPDFQTTEEGESGPTMVLLHGLFGAMSNWESFMPVAAKYSRLIALQFPLLTGKRSDVSVEALTALTECYIRVCCKEPVILCGNSLGGHVALRVALLAPELVDCLILSGSSGLYEHTVDNLPLRPSREFLHEHLERVFYNQKFVTEERLDEVVEILKSRDNHVNIIRTARSAKHDNLQDDLKKIKKPTLLLWGANDEVTPLAVAELFQSLIEGSELVTKDACGHAPMIEYPVWFSEQVEKFIKKKAQYYKNHQ
jgi:pimeloyl-ACP methyl ester carboxylesterase